MKKAVFLRIVLTAAVLALLLSGCRFVRVEEEERKPVDYTVVERRDIPEELSRLMEEKKEKEFQLSYETGEDLYLAKGYGRQMSGGYSIQVEELGESSNGIFFVTKLLGPEDLKEAEVPSYPCIVIKTRKQEKPVTFRESSSITLGGHELKDMPLSEIADQISYVSQDNYLFNRSIRENIRMGRLSATDEEVEQAAKQSGCDAFIRKLDNGYDTVVGSAGSHLSGGERQRIAIARAMLKNAPVVILDEATAYIDPENEALVQKAISTLTVGKTLIVIAHRLSTIVGADNIVVVKDGTIHAQGTHEKLLETCPLYRDMWQAHIGAKDQM